MALEHINYTLCFFARNLKPAICAANIKLVMTLISSNPYGKKEAEEKHNPR